MAEKSLEWVGNMNRTILLAYGSEFFVSRYKLYRDIVNGFNQQQTNTATNTQQNPGEQKQGDVAPAPAPAAG